MVLHSASRCTTILSGTSLLYSRISSPAGESLRRLTYAIPAPVGGAGVGVVIAAAAASISAYSATLIQANTDLVRILEEVQLLAAEAQVVTGRADWPAELNFPLMRRLADSPGWALLLEVLADSVPQEAVVLTGAELALSLSVRKPFTKSFASCLHKTLTGKPPEREAAEIIWKKKAVKIRLAADAFFESARRSNLQSESETSDNFSVALTKMIRAKIEFASDKDHQCVLDHRSQNSAQIKASAKYLRQQIECGDDDAIQEAVAVIGGLQAPMVLDMPLIGPWLRNWLMAVDLSEGCIKTSADLYGSGRAKPRVGGTKGVVPAGDIIVKPLPCFLNEQLVSKYQAHSDARNVGHILPAARARAQDITVQSRAGESCGLKPSVARLINGIGKFAVGLGIDRYIAALLTNDPRLVPTGKFYYAQATREEIWNSAGLLYESIGWGAPVPLVRGLAFGSRVTATEETVMRWYAWMLQQVQSVKPGRRYNLKGLIEHHNTYAKCCASLASFLLALRARKPIHLSAADCSGDRTSAPIRDKDVGATAGRFPVPLVPVLRDQFGLWFAHCHELDRRLDKFGLLGSSKLRMRLRQIAAGDEVSMFITVNSRKHPAAIATQDIVDWWPGEFGLEGNFGRHFWQTALRRNCVASSDIDALMRHSLRGTDPWSSTSNKVPADVIDRVSDNMTNILARLRVLEVVGLSSKARS